MISKNRAEGAIIEGVSGVSLGVAYTYLSQKEKIKEAYDQTAASLDYNKKVHWLRL